MADLFRAYQVNNVRIPTYLIESSAPINVDDAPSSPGKLPSQLTPLDAVTAIDKIASHLKTADSPNLVVMVHGFNNPQAAALPWFARASAAIEADSCLANRPGLVCVGYRWPSESILQPLLGTIAALPTVLRWVLWIGLSLSGLLVAWEVLRLTALPSLAKILLGLVAVALIATFIAATVLRAIVYFRDSHRAANYGAADLIEIIRQIDHAIMGNGEPRRNFVQLSFIGHSMGGFVVTNAIRSLSDLFATGAVKSNINAGVVDAPDAVDTPDVAYTPYGGDTLSGGGFKRTLPELGNAFHLMRFVLASPDIPAEALLSNRANYLAASLHRFHEAYLFSNEGDEVLRQISTTVNFFSFPTRSWTHGYRLGNVEILSRDYGLINIKPSQLLETLRVGHYTVKELYQKLKSAHKEQVQERLPEVFSYFDCTDYIDADDGKKVRGLLTFAKRTKQNDPSARIPGLTHLRLLFAAYVFPGKPNMHGGYFEGQLCQRLIFRLACLGAEGAVAAFNGLDQLSRECKDKQIRMLLSAKIRPLVDKTALPAGG
jgi:pimeloyl-ACP methyl ester carboxylesterase